MPSTASPAATTMAHRSHGNQAGVRLSRTNAHPAVTATAADTVSRPSQPSPRSQRPTAPMPTSAAIAGASATM